MTVTDASRGTPDLLALIDAFGESLSGRDLEASMAAIDDQEDVAVIPSEGVDVHRGTAAVRAFLERIYQGPRRYRWIWRQRWVSQAGDVAWFVAVGDEVVEESGEVRTIPYCLTGTAVRHRGRWRFRLLHGSEDAARSA
jgi:hypothetical protein